MTAVPVKRVLVFAVTGIFTAVISDKRIVSGGRNLGNSGAMRKGVVKVLVRYGVTLFTIGLPSMSSHTIGAILVAASGPSIFARSPTITIAK